MPKETIPSQDGITPVELERLSRSLLFEGMSLKRLSAIFKDSKCLRLPAKKEIYKRGEPGGEMSIILSGGVKVSTSSSDGKEVIFDLLGEGEFFGELCLLDGLPRAATVTTLVPTVLIAMDRDVLMSFMKDHSDVTMRLFHLLALRLRAVDSFLEDMLFFDSETRLAKRLMTLKDIYGKAAGDAIHIDLKISQQDIASLVGISRERVNKHLKNWEKAAIVSLQQGRVVIQNLALLQELASAAHAVCKV